jgi:hypothetical protein
MNRSPALGQISTYETGSAKTVNFARCWLLRPRFDDGTFLRLSYFSDVTERNKPRKN